ncbi:MAG: Transcription-repair coupling factor [uncultured Thermomicrobiales bacterium]|uniref:Transcription-repair-coupling factor n=1 Tax=uncultured Thermomicrobiales bacterium TaxID=1645740 RepID=A0A6J4UQU7_9BACT|nr:MAG: Transcription-repair coupling factor [uncultured Thermomicrobiales bacterium]
MSLAHLLPLLRQSEALRRIRERFDGGANMVRITDLPASARPAVLAATVGDRATPALVVTARGDRADALCAALGELLPERSPVVWPAPEALPYEQLPFDLGVATRRVALLDRLRRGDGAPPVLVASVHGLSQLVIGPDELAAQTRVLRVGERLNVDGLLRWATEVGYEPVPLVQEPGTVARRGGIVDLFPPGDTRPIRLDLFGDEIDGIRAFNPSSQRSEDRLREVVLLPPSELPLWRLAAAYPSVAALDTGGLRDEVAAEWGRMLGQMATGTTPASVDLFAPYLLDRPATLLDYLPPGCLAIVDEPAAVTLAASQLGNQAAELEAAFVANGELPAGLRPPFAAWPAIAAGLGRLPRLQFGLSAGDDAGEAVSLTGIEDAPSFAGRLGRIVEEVGARLADGQRVLVATDQVERLTEVFEERDIFPRKDKRRVAGPGGGAATPLPPGTLEIRASDLDGGFQVPDVGLLVLSDLELFGFRKQTRRGAPQRSLAESLSFAQGLNPGEHVVHVDHGIARFVGLVRMETGGVEREYMLLEYARGDKLYVPVDQSDRVTRYSGGVDPTVTRLGSGEWVKVKQRVRRAVREMAFELIQLYARRETSGGNAFPEDQDWDRELAESFPYTETADQMRAIIEVKADMESSKPMDRLVCGDVGFGKTEVALRAAFKAVNAGKQVAILVPTTVLALQHFATFSQRLAPYPVRVEMLSRLRSKADQRDVVAGLKDGTVDVVIGTHRLVQGDVRFRDLGLVVVDEEQRFGVRHKEFFKRLRTEVDVLTMSATPIPRTLHMSLAGIRDISVIDTAPQARLPIRTFVTPFEDRLVREVVLREIDRGGQVYVVHNRVHDIDRLAHKLRVLIPEARFGVGHGQMDERVLEEVVLGFVRHDYDVLISTTIIESGIDIPNVNTIVIDNADTLGLTQLYQLRGRVGRSTNRAYAYLLYRPHKSLSAEAQERLEAIQEATELGAGLKVAMRDMEIRGAGNILGAEQSGHIGEIGFDLYIRLLSQAVEEVRSGRPTTDPGAVTLDLPLTALIPAAYVADTELRLATYRRVAGVGTLRELDAMRAELVDRFGAIPEEVEHLLALIALRIRCQGLGIESVVEREREIVIRPVPTAELNHRRLNQKLGRALKLTPNSVRVRLLDLEMPWQDALDAVLDAIEEAQMPALEARAAG